MLEQLKKAYQDEEEYKRRASKTRQDATAELRETIGVKCKVSVYIGKLYGSVGSVTCARPRYESIDKLPGADVADLDALVKHFAPVPMEYRKGTFTTMRPVEYQDDKEMERDTVVQAIAPFVVRLKPGRLAECKVEWYGKTEDGETWRMSVELPYQRTIGAFGKLDLVYSREAFGREARVERCDYYPNKPFERIRWGTGEMQGYGKTPNEFTLYAPETTDVLSHVNAVLTAEAEAERVSLYRLSTPVECVEACARYLSVDVADVLVIRDEVIRIAAEAGSWKPAKARFEAWVMETGTKQTLHPTANSWYQLAGSLPEHGGETYHGGNNKTHHETPWPADGGPVV